jgi:hypothetical protein
MLTRGFGIFAKGPLYIFYTTSGLLFVDPTCQVRGRIIKIESEGSDRTRDLQVTASKNKPPAQGILYVNV